MDDEDVCPNIIEMVDSSYHGMIGKDGDGNFWWKSVDDRCWYRKPSVRKDW